VEKTLSFIFNNLLASFVTFSFQFAPAGSLANLPDADLAEACLVGQQRPRQAPQPHAAAHPTF